SARITGTAHERGRERQTTQSKMLWQGEGKPRQGHRPPRIPGYFGCFGDLRAAGDRLGDPKCASLRFVGIIEKTVVIRHAVLIELPGTSLDRKRKEIHRKSAPRAKLSHRIRHGMTARNLSWRLEGIPPPLK